MAGDISIPDVGSAIAAGKTLAELGPEFGEMPEMPEVTFASDTKVDRAIQEMFPQDLLDEIATALSVNLSEGIASLGETTISAVGLMVTTDQLNGESQ